MTYTVASLEQLRRTHEAKIAREMTLSGGKTSSGELLAVGPDITFTGLFVQISATAWNVSVGHFVTGDLNRVATYIDRFQNIPAMDRYLLSNELGDGRSLVEAPILERADDGYILKCSVAKRFARIKAQDLPADLKVDPFERDLVPTPQGGLAVVRGVEAFPQKLQMVLSIQRGEIHFEPSFRCSLLRTLRQL